MYVDYLLEHDRGHDPDETGEASDGRRGGEGTGDGA